MREVESSHRYPMRLSLSGKSIEAGFTKRRDETAIKKKKTHESAKKMLSGRSASRQGRFLLVAIGSTEVISACGTRMTGGRAHADLRRFSSGVDYDRASQPAVQQQLGDPRRALTPPLERNEGSQGERDQVMKDAVHQWYRGAKSSQHQNQGAPRCPSSNHRRRVELYPLTPLRLLPPSLSRFTESLHLPIRPPPKHGRPVSAGPCPRALPPPLSVASRPRPTTPGAALVRLRPCLRFLLVGLDAEPPCRVLTSIQPISRRKQDDIVLGSSQWPTCRAPTAQSPDDDAARFLSFVPGGGQGLAICPVGRARAVRAARDAWHWVS